MKNLFGLAMVAVALAGCAYNAPVAVTPNLNVYSSYDDKLQGSYALYVNGDAYAQVVRPTGINCAAHNYPIDMRDAFRQSVIKTMQQLVDEVEVVETPMSGEALSRSGKRGQINIRAEGLTARVQFIPGFWSASTQSTVELSANLSVDGLNGRVLGTTAEGTGTAQGDAGMMCGGGAEVVAQAAEKATKQLLGQLGERLSNSPRMRTEAPAVKTPAFAKAAPPARMPAHATPLAPSAATPAPNTPVPTTRVSAERTAPTLRRNCIRVLTDPSQNKC